MEGHVQAFFEFVQMGYTNIEDTVSRVFEESVSFLGLSKVPNTPSSASEATSRKLKKSLESFKVLTECPIIIALLFQLHKKYVAANVPVLVPLIIKTIKLVPQAQEIAHSIARSEGRLQIGMAKGISNRLAYSELIALQVYNGLLFIRLKLCRL